MREFDRKLWTERAQERFKKCSRKGVAKRGARPNLADDIVMIRNMDRLVDWCRQRGVKVTFVKERGAVYYPDFKVIKLSHKLKLDKQVAYLLHECGHHLIGMKADDRFSMGYPQWDPNHRRTFLHRATCLEEEFEAWHRGWRLAQRLRIVYDRRLYNRFRLACIRSYIKWSLRRYVDE